MKPYIFIIGLAVLLASVFSHAHGAEMSITVGTFHHRDGAMQTVVDDINGKRSAALMALDKHAINRIYYKMSRSDLIKLRALLDSTIKEMDRKGGTAYAMEQ